MDYKIKLKNIRESCNIVNIDHDAVNYATSQILDNFKSSNVVFIAKNQLEIDKIKKQLIFFNPNIEQEYEILPFYPWDCRPYDNNPVKSSITTNRIKTLYKITNNKERKYLIITTINTILQKIPDKSTICKSSLLISQHDEISSDQIANSLIYNGYTRQSLAYIAGEFSIRGGIIDIVTSLAGGNTGYRLDMFGNEIESIKYFDPMSQLSQDKVSKIEILPASEIILNEETVANFRNNYRRVFSASFNPISPDEIYESISNKRYLPGLEHYLPLFFNEPLTNLFSYLPNCVVFYSVETDNVASDFYQQIQQSYDSRIEDAKIDKFDQSSRKPLPVELLYHKPEEISELIKSNINIQFHSFDCGDKNSRIVDLGFKTIPDFNLAAKAGRRDPLELAAEYSQSLKKKIFFAAVNDNSKNRIKGLLNDLNKDTPIVEIELDRGFEASDFAMISEQLIFGPKLTRKKPKKNKDAAKKILEEGLTINISELVVHRDHGIGRFEGIQKISAVGIETDMVKIVYDNEDTLFICVDDIDLITRYGENNPLIKLDRLGVVNWRTRKDKVKKRIKIAAAALIKIAAARKLKKGKIFLPNDHFYEEFQVSFGFVETGDQMEAINAVEEDLANGTPMDRLICGDVGFGKTEVAMRASFIVASSNYDYEDHFEQITSGEDVNLIKIKRNQNISQVAIITPTTILCRQHFNNFAQRFKGTGIRIAQLSRLTTPAQNKKTKEALEKGEIDIVIGTHALLGKNLKFKNLSLLVIDEEQHFGVAQKERLKEFKNEVHILTLSATPIPRTLQMSLTGIKDLSLIATPPVDRLAIRNFVMPFDLTIAKEAIIREYQRNGKVFFVTPYIKHIDELKRKLSQVLPEEIKMTHAHGQMAPSKIETIMNDFFEDRIDVLLSTTIIESGIDVATANTIIIHKAEMFGLSQLYQLRGRVGRSKTQAYAYFMMSNKEVNEAAKKKLKVMQNLDELGVGFNIASHDMDIRGSGDIIGDEQSGHIKDTGMELYQQMLLEEIEKVKNKIDNSETSDVADFEFNPQIKLSISLSIPESYMSDLSLRMSFYKKIAKITSFDEQGQLEDEFLDRFGKIPDETRNLIQVSIIKNICKKLKVSKVQAVPEGIFIAFKNNKFSKTDQLLDLVFKSQSLIKIQKDHRILFSKEFIFAGNNSNSSIIEAEQKIKSAFKVLDILQNL